MTPEELNALEKRALIRLEEIFGGSGSSNRNYLDQLEALGLILGYIGSKRY